MADVIHAAGVLRIGLGSFRRGVREASLTALREVGMVSAIRCRNSGLHDDGLVRSGVRWHGQWHRQSTPRSGPAPAWRQAIVQPRIVAASRPSHSLQQILAEDMPAACGNIKAVWSLAQVVTSRRRCECAMNAALRSSSGALWLNASNHAAGLGVCNGKVRSNDHQADSRRGCPGRGCAHHSGVCCAACGAGVDVDRGARRPTPSHALAPAPSLSPPLPPLPRGLPRLLA